VEYSRERRKEKGAKRSRKVAKCFPWEKEEEVLGRKEKRGKETRQSHALSGRKPRGVTGRKKGEEQLVILLIQSVYGKKGGRKGSEGEKKNHSAYFFDHRKAGRKGKRRRGGGDAFVEGGQGREKRKKEKRNPFTFSFFRGRRRGGKKGGEGEERKKKEGGGGFLFHTFLGAFCEGDEGGRRGKKINFLVFIAFNDGRRERRRGDMERGKKKLRLSAFTLLPSAQRREKSRSSEKGREKKGEMCVARPLLCGFAQSGRGGGKTGGEGEGVGPLSLGSVIDRKEEKEGEERGEKGKRRLVAVPCAVSPAYPKRGKRAGGGEERGSQCA